jgi:aminoglycoside/choline kinase family phosphotransferase
MHKSSSSPVHSGSELDPGPLAVQSALRLWGLKSEIVGELAGGASTRRFFRVPWEGGTAIAMFIPLPSQEIAKARQARGGGPFVEVARLLESVGVPVPAVLRRSDEHHVLLVEDLGDDTLANYLLRKEGARLELYRTAVTELAGAQRQLDSLPEDSVVRQRAFDEDLLRWEVDHFRTWALEARGIVLSPQDADVFDRCAAYLAATIASWDRGFVHRDYQSRNLMVTEGPEGLKLTWIDFQDAMMGPRAYDLVALLTDSYQTFTRAFIEARLDEYCAARGIESERERVGFEFDFITVQRKLKDAGRFIFIDRVNQNGSFLPFVESTIEKARAALLRVRGEGPLGELDELLGRVLERA